MDKLEALLRGIGAIAEISLLYYKSCIGAGASEDEAINLTGMFLEIMMRYTQGEDE